MQQAADGRVAPGTSACASCGRPLAGPYCSQCGERALDQESLTVRHLLTRTVPAELFDVDGKLWRTFRRLLLNPGFLSQEYSAGRRTLYLTPLRLLLIAIVVYALATQGGFLVTMMLWRVSLSIAPTAVPTSVSVPDTVERIDRFGVLGRMLEAKARTTNVMSERAQAQFHRSLNRFAQPVSFANVVLLALLLHWLFRRRRGLFVENAAFSMHAVSFVLISSVTLLPALWIMDSNRAVGLGWILIVFIWQFLYLAAAVRRYYLDAASRRWPRLGAYASALLIYVVNSGFVTIVQMIGGAIAIRGL